jgi:hypothetical protein
MTSTLKRRIIWFASLSGLHLFLYQASFMPQTLSGFVLYLSWLPWLPLAWAHIAVASHLLPTPTVAGLGWCATVWLTIYWLLAKKLAQRPNIRKRLPVNTERMMLLP